MSSLNLNLEEFNDIVVLFLYDKINNTSKDNISEVIDKMNSLGLKSVLYKRYLQISSNTRMKYKIIKPFFERGDAMTLFLSNKIKEDFFNQEYIKLI